MTTVTFKGETLNVGGNFPLTGDTARSFMLVDKDLNDVPLSKFYGMRKILNIVPSPARMCHINPEVQRNCQYSA